MLHVFVPRRSENVEAAKITAKAFREHDTSLKSIADTEIKSKDRVDISLSEYERLKVEIEALKRENTMLRDSNSHLVSILARIGIEPGILEKIDPNTVTKFTMINPRDFTTTFRIEFAVEDTYRDGARIKHIRF